MGRNSMLENQKGQRKRVYLAAGKAENRHALDIFGDESGPDMKTIRFGSLRGCVMSTRPRRGGSKGIRIYFHYQLYPAWLERSRESHNYHAGLDAVRALVADKTVKVVGVGCESGAMCLHYRRIW